MIQILVVDDDKNIRKLISTHLMQRGYDPTGASNGAVALDVMETKRFDMVIVDVMMPEVDGYELTEEIRRMDNDIPILMVTARDTFADKKRGFTKGIDDYITKPLDIDEMMLRVDALLRRAKINVDHEIQIGNTTISLDARTVTTGTGDRKENHELPRREFDLLYKLLSYPKKTFTRRQLMDDIWGMDSDADERTVDVHIKRLREKFQDCGDFAIVTVRGLGYKAELADEVVKAVR